MHTSVYLCTQRALEFPDLGKRKGSPVLLEKCTDILTRQIHYLQINNLCNYQQTLLYKLVLANIAFLIW